MSIESENVVEEEVNILEAIYIHELEVIRNDSNEITEIVLQLHPATGDNLEEQYVCMTLVLGIPKQYPDEVPNIEIRNPRGLGEEEVQSTLEAMLSLSEERKGEAMLYELIELGKECLTEGNIPRCACMICLEHFVEGDKFQKTSCYHYFHDVCLGRYVKHVLSQEPEVKAAHTKAEPKKVLCPVCRAEINYTEDSFPETPVEEKFIYFPSEEMKQQQGRMAAMLERQRQQGGLIDLEAEKNKYLLKAEDVVYLNPVRRLSTDTSSNVSTDNLAELGSEKEEADNRGQNARGGSIANNIKHKGRGQNFQGSSGHHSSNKFRDNTGGRNDRNNRNIRPEIGGRSRKGYDTDDYSDRSYSGRDRDYRYECDRGHGRGHRRGHDRDGKYNYDDDYYDDYDDDYEYMETHRQHDKYQSTHSKHRNEDSRDNTKTEKDRGTGDYKGSDRDGRTSSAGSNKHSDRPTNRYSDNRRHKYRDDNDRSKYSRNDRYNDTNRTRTNHNKSTRDAKSEHEKSDDRKNVDSNHKLSSEGKEDESEPWRPDSGKQAEIEINVNDSSKTSHENDEKRDASDKSNNRNKGYGAKSESYTRLRTERSDDKHHDERRRYPDDRRQYDRPQSGRSYGRGRARTHNTDEKMAGSDEKTVGSDYYRGGERRSNNMNSPRNDRDKVVKSGETRNNKDRDSKIQDDKADGHDGESEKIPNMKSSPNKTRPRGPKSGSRQAESSKRDSKDIPDKSDNPQRRTQKDDKYSQSAKSDKHNSNTVRNIADCDTDQKKYPKGRGRGRGFNRNKNPEDRHSDKPNKDSRDNDKDKKHSIDSIVSKIKDIKVEANSDTVTKSQAEPGAANQVFNTSNSDTKPSIPPGFCVKPPPGF